MTRRQRSKHVLTEWAIPGRKEEQHRRNRAGTHRRRTAAAAAQTPEGYSRRRRHRRRTRCQLARRLHTAAPAGRRTGGPGAHLLVQPYDCYCYRIVYRIRCEIKICDIT